jgi:hypothetical protein
MSISPILLAMLVCDTTIRDIQSKKISLIGCFSSIFAKEMPFVYNQFSLFVCVTEVIGTVPITIQIKNLLNDEILVKDVSIKIESTDSTNPIEFVVTLNNVVFPNLGQYAIELFGYRELLGSVKISISKIPNKDGL